MALTKPSNWQLSELIQEELTKDIVLEAFKEFIVKNLNLQKTTKQSNQLYFPFQDIFEEIKNEIIKKRLRQRESLGWGKLHKKLLSLPFCAKRQQIVKIIECLKCPSKYSCALCRKKIEEGACFHRVYFNEGYKNYLNPREIIIFIERCYYHKIVYLDINRDSDSSDSECDEKISLKECDNADVFFQLCLPKISLKERDAAVFINKV